MSPFQWILAATFAGITLAFVIAWVVLLKKPLMPDVSKYKEAFASKKAKWGIAAVVIAVILLIVCWMFGEILTSTWENPSQSSAGAFITTYWMWILMALVVIYFVLKEQGITRALVGTALVVGTVTAIIIGTHSQLTTGSMIPSGCSDEPILAQAPVQTFELEQGCVATLDLSLLAQKVHEETGDPRAKFNPKVERDASANPLSIVEADESQIITALGRPRYVGHQLVWKIKANDDLEQFGVTTVKLKAFSLETAK